MRRIYQLHICTIACAAYKRRGQTKVFPLLLIPLLLIPLLFLAVVHRFLSESYTDIEQLPEYDWIDISALHTLKNYYDAKDFMRLAPHPSRLRRATFPPNGGKAKILRYSKFSTKYYNFTQHQ